MTNPVQHDAVAVLVGAPSIATLFAPWPFAIAFIASVIALIYMTSDYTLKIAVKQVFASTVIAGCFSQWLAKPIIHVISNIHVILSPLKDTAELPSIAFLAMAFGLICHAVMPAIFEKIERYRQQNKTSNKTGVSPDGDSA